MTKPGLCGVKQRRRHAAEAGKIAHQQKQRNNGQRIAGEGAVSLVLQLTEYYQEGIVDHIAAENADGEHGQADWNAQKNENEKDGEGPDADFQIAHDSSPLTEIFEPVRYSTTLRRKHQAATMTKTMAPNRPAA